MLITIACRHNYGRVLINKHGNPDKTKSISRNSIACVVDDEERMIVFGGIVKAHRAEQFKAIILLRIEGYSFDETGLLGFIDLPRSCKLRGALYNDKAYMLVDDECKPCPI
ncbi:hypothetical protein [Pseudoalteromonas sp. A25]|uniref:hypothetical protein n=1 Tax=Pseudoalteromonas sp. A25 TaxID=116092 RepID=UPI0012612B27|nr:hypothetical protein [Pseudoalteromonas sp. A25]